MAVVSNSVWYVNGGNGTSTAYFAIAVWTASTTTAAATLRRQTSAAGGERVFICIVAGTTGATEPTWNTGKGNTTTDNTVTWMEATGQAALNADLTNTPASSQNRSGAQALGTIIKNNAGTFLFIATTAGTTGSSEPTYSTTTGSTTTDGTVTWTCIGAPSAYAAWATAFPRVNQAVQTGWAIAGHAVYVSSIHTETLASTTAIVLSSTSPATSIYCVANAGNIPPQASDLTTGAVIGATSTGSITFRGGYFDIQGITFNVGSGASACSLNFGQNSFDNFHLKNCAISIVSTATTSLLNFTAPASNAVLDNVSVTFSNASQRIVLTIGSFTWRNSTPLGSGTTPTFLFLNTGGGGVALIEAVDLSGATNNIIGNAGNYSFVLKNCKLPTGTLVGTLSAGSQATIDFINCDTAGLTYNHARYRYQATLSLDTIAIRTSGASDGTVAIAWKIVTTANASFYDPFDAFPIAIWNAVTGANVTVTLQGAYNGAALPNNDNIWLDLEYFGTASSTLGTRRSGTKATPLTTASAQGASTVAWDSAASARANSTAYTAGQFIKLASNTGRLFICTTAGTSASSEPSGYATAVDGGSVTDGTATFRALVRFTLTATLSSPQPQSVGYIYAYVRTALASSTFWVDPVLTLS